MRNNQTSNSFDKQQADSYDSRWKTLAPFNESLHLQLALVLSELPEHARILCVGAGTGAELLALAKRYPKWRFLAVDPSQSMLEVCQRKVEESGFSDRCAFHAGFVSEIPDTECQFDAATSILVSHFLVESGERLLYFREIRKRLRLGGLLATGDLSEAPRGQQVALMPVWLRMIQHAGATFEQVQGMLDAYERSVSMLPEEAMESLLVEAGFERPTLFAQSLLIRSWFARAS
ncbi:Methyltransferase domain family [Verrucomicrobiia bacterium DG1235]|nr:Methyltransferase domain family [Verrucomicrobiae bacterium DG1235]